MKACPNCYLSFNDGYICPHCGGQLVDYSPTQTGSYQSQSSYYDPPAQAYQQSAPQYAQPAAAGFPPTIIKKRTGLVVFLIILLLALGAFAGYLVYEEYNERTQPTELETEVVNGAWEWYSTVDGMFTVLEEMLDAADENASGDAGATDNSTANAAGDQLASEVDAELLEEANATVSPGDGVNTQADASSPAATQPSAETAANVHNSDIGSDDISSIADAVGDAEAAAMSDAMEGTHDALDQSIEVLGQTIGDAMAAATTITTIANSELLDSVDLPMQALNEKYPDLVSSWNGVKNALTTDLSSLGRITMAAIEFRRAGESFKRQAESSGFVLS